MGSLRAGL